MVRRRRERLVHAATAAARTCPRMRHHTRPLTQTQAQIEFCRRPLYCRYDKEGCPGTASMRTLFMVGEDAGSCLRVISTQRNKFNRALMGYCLQSHVRILVVFDSVKRCAQWEGLVFGIAACSRTSAA